MESSPADDFLYLFTARNSNILPLWFLSKLLLGLCGSWNSISGHMERHSALAVILYSGPRLWKIVRYFFTSWPTRCGGLQKIVFLNSGFETMGGSGATCYYNYLEASLNGNSISLIANTLATAVSFLGIGAGSSSYFHDSSRLLRFLRGFSSAGGSFVTGEGSFFGAAPSLT